MVDFMDAPAALPVINGTASGYDGGHPALNGGDPRAGGGDSPPPTPAANVNDGIAGMSALRGLMLYGAMLAFAGLYVDFMIVISRSRAGVTPHIDATLISAAAALSGVLGSAFALKIGAKPNPSSVNHALATHIASSTHGGRRASLGADIRRALSLEPSAVGAKIWPLTFGIWAYAVIGSAVAVVYVLNQHETPDAVKALAVLFSGYVIALINSAYGMTQQAPE